MLADYTREFKTNLNLAIPVITGMLGHTLVVFADNVMVGQLGTAELAAVSLANSLILVFMYVGTGFSTAITPLVAEADGAANAARAKMVFKHGLVLCVLISVLLFGAIHLCKPLMKIAEQPVEVVALALPFVDLVAVSIIPMILFQALKQFADGLSETKMAMYATLVANGLNVLLNYLLIFGTFGFPKLGIIGAGIGTLVSRVAMVLILWGLLFRKERIKPLITQLDLRKYVTPIFKKIIQLGFPSALQVFFEVALFTGAIWLSGVLGKNAQAANQIALNLSSMTYMVGVGLGVAATIRVGNQLGKEDFLALRRIGFSIFLLALLITIGFAFAFFMGKNWLPTLYLDLDDVVNQTDNIEVVLLAAQLIMVSAFFQLSDGLQVVALGALRGLQDVKIPTFITFVAYWVIGFPISYYLGLKTELKSIGIWIGLLAGLSASALMLYFRFRSITTRLIKLKPI